MDYRSEVIFFDPSKKTLPWQPILWAKSTSNPQLVVRITFARAAPSAYDKKGDRYAGRRQKANKLLDSMDAGKPINLPINNN